MPAVFSGFSRQEFADIGHHILLLPRDDHYETYRQHFLCFEIDSRFVPQHSGSILSSRYLP
ncbi:hypothetical protein C0J52_24718 [Blattella germanica]|nr:hypothetical protein C0J52_24718 [Blattella germanica]